MVWSDTLFYIAFLGQIFLISHYFPQRITRRMRYMLDTYPPSEYPKLYPKPAEYRRLGIWIYEQANRAIVVIGLLLLVAIIFWVDHANFADDGFISEFWPAAYCLLQALPTIALELTEFGHHRLMRQANVTSIRKADLRPRRLFNFISPTLLATTIGIMLISITFGSYLYDFDVGWGHDSAQQGLLVVGTNVFFVALGSWLLYSRKPDPHQATVDRTRHIAASLNSFAYVSIVVSVFMMYHAADGVYDIDYLDAAVMSIYFQAIVFLTMGHLLRSLPIESLNFDVYRDEEHARDIDGPNVPAPDGPTAFGRGT